MPGKDEGFDRGQAGDQAKKDRIESDLREKGVHGTLE